MHKLILSFLLLFSLQIFSQSITMEFPAFAGKTYDFIIFQGSKQETVQKDTIPANGKFTLKIPEQYAPYKGMCRWLITNTADGGGLDMAIPGYNFSVSCLSDKPNNDIIIYKGFDAVNELNRLNGIQRAIIDKFETMSRATQLYDKNDKLYKKFAQEKELQVKAYQKFLQDLKENINYNAQFLPIVNVTQGIPHRLTDNYNQKALLVNEFITQKISFEDMYVSGHWQGIIQSWVVLQMNVVNDKEQFVKDFKLISDRMKNPTHYNDFVGKLTYYLTQYSKDDYIEGIANIILGSGKISNYVGSLEVYIKAMVGIKAPNLVITEHISKVENANQNTKTTQNNIVNSKYSLLVFYKSGCGPCEVTIEDLKSNYELLKEMEIKIIAISGDEEEQEFQNTAAHFPWQETYCDFKGTAGLNFKNYAVMGTPTLFLLDSKDVIIQKPAKIADVLTWMKTN